jgi:hypothetical protein
MLSLLYEWSAGSKGEGRHTLRTVRAPLHYEERIEKVSHPPVEVWSSSGPLIAAASPPYNRAGAPPLLAHPITPKAVGWSRLALPQRRVLALERVEPLHERARDLAHLLLGEARRDVLRAVLLLP